MKKILIIVIYVLVIILMVGCSNRKTLTLQGFYQSTMENGYNIQFSFGNDNAFVSYIENIEINKGIYKSIGDGKYILKGDKYDLEIKLERNNSFNINIEKLVDNLNDGEPIKLKKVGETPVYFE